MTPSLDSLDEDFAIYLEKQARLASELHFAQEELQAHRRVIGILLDRLGGKVTLSIAELVNADDNRVLTTYDDPSTMGKVLEVGPPK